MRVQFEQFHFNGSVCARGQQSSNFIIFIQFRPKLMAGNVTFSQCIRKMPKTKLKILKMRFQFLFLRRN